MLNKIFATHHDAIRGEDFRFYVFSNYLYSLCIVIHIILAIFFYAIDVHLLSLFNVFSTLIFVGNLFLNRYGKLKIAVHLSLIEIAVHAALASLCLGWESNFSFYSIAICSVIMFSNFLRLKTKILEVLLSTLLYVATYVFLMNYTPIYEVNHLIIALLGFANILVIISLMTFTFYNFYATTERLSQRLKNSAEIDGLTGIYNRRFFNEYSEIEIKRVANERNYAGRAHQTNFALAIVDLDDFKKINDTYGHIAGDQVLIQTVEIIKNIII